jgi:hypothetical protein
MKVMLTALNTGRALLPRNIVFLLLVFISARNWVNLRAIVRLGGLGELRKNQLPHWDSNTRPFCLLHLRYRVPPSILAIFLHKFLNVSKIHWAVHENIYFSPNRKICRTILNSLKVCFMSPQFEKIVRNRGYVMSIRKLLWIENTSLQIS